MWVVSLALLLTTETYKVFGQGQSHYIPPANFTEAQTYPVILEEHHNQWLLQFTALEVAKRHKNRLLDPWGTFTNMRTSILEQLQLIKDIFGKCGLSWWVDSGTAIAVYRDGILFPWEHDADVGVFSSDALQIPSCLLSVYGHGKAIPYRNISFIVRVGENMHTLLLKTFHGNSSLPCFVDVIVFAKSDKRVWIEIPGDLPRRGTDLTMPITALLPLQEKRFETMTVYAPNNLKAYLNAWYGKDLGVPADKKSRWEEFLKRRERKEGSESKPNRITTPRPQAKQTNVSVRNQTHSICENPANLEKMWVHGKKLFFLRDQKTDKHIGPYACEDKQCLFSIISRINGMELDVFWMNGEFSLRHDSTDTPIFEFGAAAGTKNESRYSLRSLLSDMLEQATNFDKIRLWIDWKNIAHIQTHDLIPGLKKLSAMMDEFDLHGRLYVETPDIKLSRLIYAHKLQPLLYAPNGNRNNLVSHRDLQHVCAVVGHARQIYQTVQDFPQISFFAWFTSTSPGHSGWPGSVKFWACQKNVHVILAFPSESYQSSEVWGRWSGLECDQT
eukprot:m.217808 g.217808  ORF g.217808 m.217808 type:complete len:557 (+) comp15892_c1_seq13:545-2215(+)